MFFTSIPLDLILIIVAAAVGVIFVIVGLVYVLGNVYNGLVRRREKVKRSWHELSKILRKYFDLVPLLVKKVKAVDTQEELRSLYHDFKDIDLRKDISSCEKFYQGIEFIYNRIEKDDSDIFEFFQQYRRLIDFSIPLYNANVRDYNRFRKMFFNIFMARTFSFQEASYFSLSEKVIIKE